MGEFLTTSMQALQEKFQTRRLAEKVFQRVFRNAFTNADKEFIENSTFFFIATVDASGRPQCSYKGGPRGFAAVTNPSELSFPIYEGNGLYLSAGNIAETGNVDILFIDFEKQARLRINGRARIDNDYPLLAQIKAAQLFVRVDVSEIHPNCSRHVHPMKMQEISSYTPKSQDCDVGKASWGEQFFDVLPEYMKHPTVG